MEIITANELLSGGAVYVDVHGSWQADINAARLFGKEETTARDNVIAQAKAFGRLISVEIETVKVVGNKIVADRLRERIRAGGPTAPYGPKRQILGDDGHVSIR